MHLAPLLSIALAQWLAPAPTIPPASTGELFTGSNVALYVDYRHMGADVWPWAGPPAIDCIANASGHLVCGGSAGVSFSEVGTFSVEGTPFYPNGFAKPGRYASRFNGSSYLTGTLGFSPSTVLAVCVVFRPDNVSGTQHLASMYHATGNSTFVFFQRDATIRSQFYGQGTATSIEPASNTLQAGAWTAACTSYDGVAGPGAATVRLRSNGVAASPVTTGIAPLNPAEVPITIGASPIGAAPFSGAIHRVTVWTDWRPDNYAIANAVGSQLGRGITYPKEVYQAGAGRTSTASVCPAGDATCYTIGQYVTQIDKRGAYFSSSNTSSASAQFAPRASPVGPWSVAMTVTRTDWTTGVPAGIFGTGAAGNGKLSARITGSPAQLACTIIDSTANGAGERTTFANFDNAVLTHRFGCVYRTSGGSPEAWVDGIQVSTSTQGSGLGKLTSFTGVWLLGTYTDYGTLPGWYRDFLVCDTPDMRACDRSLRRYPKAELSQ